MSDIVSIEVEEQKLGKLGRLTQKQVTPENAQSTAWVGSIAVGLTVQALTKDGWEGAIYGAGASVTGLLTVVSLLSISVSIPAFILIAAAGGILGTLPKPLSRDRHSNSGG
jgi:hypothetical protein